MLAGEGTSVVRVRGSESSTPSLLDVRFACALPGTGIGFSAASSATVVCPAQEDSLSHPGKRPRSSDAAPAASQSFCLVDEALFAHVPVHLRPLRVPESWAAVVDAFGGQCVDLTTPAPIVMVVGASGLGKSTLLRLLARRGTIKMAQVSQPCMVLDLDPGQPEWGLPGTISLWKLNGAPPPLGAPPALTAAVWNNRYRPTAVEAAPQSIADGTAHDHETNAPISALPGLVSCRWVGLTAVDTHAELFVAAAGSLAAAYAECAAAAAGSAAGAGAGSGSYGRRPGPCLPLLVNTFGWIRGAGMEVLEQVMTAIGPSVVLALEGAERNKQFLAVAPPSLQQAHRSGSVTVAALQSWDHPAAASARARPPVPAASASATAATPSCSPSSPPSSAARPDGPPAASTAQEALSLVGEAAALRFAAGMSTGRGARTARLVQYMCQRAPAHARGGPGGAWRGEMWHPRWGQLSARAAMQAGPAVALSWAVSALWVVRPGEGVVTCGADAEALQTLLLQTPVALLQAPEAGPRPGADLAGAPPSSDAWSAAPEAVVGLVSTSEWLGVAVPFYATVSPPGSLRRLTAGVPGRLGRAMSKAELSMLTEAADTGGAVATILAHSPVPPELAVRASVLGVSPSLPLPLSLRQGAEQEAQTGLWHAMPGVAAASVLDELSLGLPAAVRVHEELEMEGQRTAGGGGGGQRQPHQQQQARRGVRRSGDRMPAGATAMRARPSLQRRGGGK